MSRPRSTAYGAFLRRLRPALLALSVAPAVLLGGCSAVADDTAGGGAAGRPTATPPAGRPAPSRSATPRPAATATPRPAATATSRPAGDARPAAAGATTIVFVDVGQGDAIIVRSGRVTVLVDGGPPGAAWRVSAQLSRLGVRRLDALLVTHAHLDHVGALPALVWQYRPRRAYVAARPGALTATLRQAGTRLVTLRRGDTLRWGRARVRVLSPARLSGDLNADSLVVLMQAAGRRVLLTGDLTGPNEAAVGAICARGPPVDVLKVAHHGSRYSTTTAFLAGARPRVAVICVGRNPYGHPSPDTLARLRAFGVRVYSTQRNGTLTVRLAPGRRPVWRATRTLRPLVP